MQLQIAAGRPPLPKEHGAWAMLITPIVVAPLAAGLDPLALSAALGWFAAYCLRGPIEALRGASPTGRAGRIEAAPSVARFWLLLLGALTIALLGPVLYLRPQALLLMLGAALLLAVVQTLADRGQARSISAGLLAVCGLVVGGPLYYLAATGTVGQDGWTLALACAAFFGGSVFRVKTVARERRSGSFKLFSALLHAAFFLGAVAAAWWAGLSWLLPLAMLPPAVWAVQGAVRAGAPVNLAAVGKAEQWLTILFGLILAAALRF